MHNVAFNFAIALGLCLHFLTLPAYDESRLNHAAVEGTQDRDGRSSTRRAGREFGTVEGVVRRVRSTVIRWGRSRIAQEEIAQQIDGITDVEFPTVVNIRRIGANQPIGIAEKLKPEHRDDIGKIPLPIRIGIATRKVCCGR